MPPTLFGFVWRVSGRNQIWISLLAVGVFVLNTAPLELQRRILNATVAGGNFKLLLVLALAYAGVMLTEGLVKLLMNVYRGWVAENAVRVLRLTTSTLIASGPKARTRPASRGPGRRMIIAPNRSRSAHSSAYRSPRPLQIGVLLSVFGYMFYLHTGWRC
jgi:hypothetical protein